MRSDHAIILLLLPAVGGICHALEAGELGIPTGAFQPRPAAVLPAEEQSAGARPRFSQASQSFFAPAAAAPAAPPSVRPPEPVAGLTLDELKQIALQCNPTLVQAGMAIRAAEGRRVQAGLYPNPNIGYLADEIGNDGSEGLQGGFFSQEIVTEGKLRLARAAAGHEIQQARHVREAQVWRVMNDVRAGYYEVLLSQRMIEVNEELARVGDKGAEVTEKLRAAMEVSQADVLQARIEAETAGLGLIEARNRYRGSWQRLVAVLGQPQMEPTPLVGDVTENLPDLSWDDCYRRLLGQSPQLAQARAGVERARCELALQQSLRTPNLEAGAAVKYDTGSEFTVVDVEVAVPWPVFDRNQGNIAEAEANLSAAQFEVRRVELDLQDRMAAAFEQYANARRQVEVYRNSILPSARSALDLIAMGYREGEFGYLELLTSQRTFFDVNLKYLANLGELWARSIELEGMLLTGGLEEIE